MSTSGSDYGMQLRNDSDVLIWDSRYSGGGVIADVIVLPANDTSVITKNYTQFAGRNAKIIVVSPSYMDSNSFGTVDTDSGYPKLTTISVNFAQPRIIIVNVY